jgi:hypothetical protein
MCWFWSQSKIMSVCLQMAESFFTRVRFDCKNISQITFVGSKVQTRGSIYEPFACIGMASGAI